MEKEQQKPKALAKVWAHASMTAALLHKKASHSSAFVLL
jgi:hypothetical protein